jgi:hypothetical protein
MSDERRLEQARAVKDRHTDALMRFPGVVAVGVGLRQVGGEYTPEVAIVVMVREKRPPDELAPEDIIPRELEGIPVDVQEAGDIQV